MEHIDQTYNFLDYMQNYVLNTLKTALATVPKEKFDYRPEGELNTLKFLFYHVVNSPFIYLSGIGKEEFLVEDYNRINIDINSINSPQELIDYYNTFFKFIEGLKTTVKNQYLNEIISYSLDKVGWGSWNLTGLRAFETAFEEMTHHRGELYI